MTTPKNSVSESPKVCILLATYNGQDYISEQLESLLSQTYSNWILVVSDDSSSDSTLAVIKDYSVKDDRIVMIGGSGKNQGVLGNFGRLLQWAKERAIADYFCFCDQDDVWLDNKLELMLTVLKEEEAKFPGTPILAHSDLTVANKSLKVLNKSFVRHMGLTPEVDCNFTALMFRNQVTGCATMFNRELLQVALPLPLEARMHDWWFALIASLTGKIVYLDIPTILYRQHGNNTVGAMSLTSFLAKYLNIKKNLREGNREFNENIAQIRPLIDKYEGSSLVEAKKIESMKRFCNLKFANRSKRLHILQSLRPISHNWIFRILVSIRVFLLK